MKTLLICPTDREGVAALAETIPLSNLPVFGKSLVEHWLVHLVGRGATEVCLLSSDRPEQLRMLVGDGARWGLRVTVQPEIRELTPDEARTKYCNDEVARWLPSPHDVALMDYLPGLPEFPLFENYAGWFTALREWLPHASTADRIGVREIKPNIWVGLRAQVSPKACLCAPCWIGEHVYVGPDAVIGPMAVVEDNSLIEQGAQVTNSIVGSDTFVGEFVEVQNSMAIGGTLVNWKSASCVKVSDAFLLSSLVRPRSTINLVTVFGRLSAALILLLTTPLALVLMLTAKLRGLTALLPRVAVRPRGPNIIPMPGDTLVYHELTTVSGWVRRWPQLWKVVKGEFTWIGNRPLSPDRAAHLSNDFEQLWLAAPIGLISLADVEACYSFFGDDTRAHASYYAAQAHWRLDLSILARALYLLMFDVSYSQTRRQFSHTMQAIQAGQQEAH